MKRFQKNLIEAMEIRAFRNSTKTAYISTLNQFYNFHQKPLDKLGIKDIEKFQKYLKNDKRLNPRTINRHTSALKFFYQLVLKKNWNFDIVARMKTKTTLPQYFSMDEIKRMIEALTDIKHKAIFMTLYSAGLRMSEVQNLRPTDIDSKQMVIKINDSKGAKDRLALLSPNLLNLLRRYWVENKDDKSTWLFPPSQNPHRHGDTNKKLSHTSISYIVKKAAKKANIKKKLLLTVFDMRLVVTS